MSNDRLKASLYELARLYNVQTAYYGLHHRRKQASVESLLGVLKALGAPVASMNDVLSALRERRQAHYQRIMEPVTVVWNGEKPAITVCLPSNVADSSGTAQLELESGESFNREWSAGELSLIESTDIEGKRYVTKRIMLPEVLPWGYHKFIFRVEGISGETMIISAPQKGYSPPDGEGSRQWGAFLPLYALRRQNGWGSGDYSGLGTLADWVAELGGQVLATLPLLPVFLDEPFEPSPYAPVSRLLWNEFYVDITRVPELAACTSAQALIQSASFQAEIKTQQKKSMVDYRKLMSLKRQVMAELCRCLVNSPTGRLEEFKRFDQEHPLIEEYARFRAVMEKQNAPWPKWPQRLRDGNIQESDYNEEIKDYHLYAQWLAHQQVQALSENARKRGIRLYFDLPVGVHSAGYDVWRHHNVFALNAAAGAPPDAVFTNGQNWGFPPIHPENIREEHYRYVIDYLRHHLRYADMLRIDHVMGLHRLFWIPQGLNAGDGVYVRYHAEELYAILAVESHRHQSIIVGEDLGIVPSYVRPAMAKHGLSRMYILYYELAENNPNTFGHITPNTVASLNTHDMPPFAAFWQAIDITEKKGLGLLDAKGARKESKTRQRIKAALIRGLRKKNLLRKADTGTRAVLQACLAFLSNSPAFFILINLEDLWLETQSQNVPGTGDKYPSWQRKTRYSLEEFCRRQDVRDILEGISSLRKQGKNPVHKNKRL